MPTLIASRPTQAEFDHHKNHQEDHKVGNPLRDVILGGQDGIVNALGIVLGISAVSNNVSILVAAVLAASAAEAISMAAVAYTSANAQKAYYESERLKEIYELEHYPRMEREEVHRIFEAKGFKGKVLTEIVDTITSDQHLWIDTMMREELGIEKVETKNILKSSVIVGVATALGSIIPVIPFFFVPYIYSFQVGDIISVSFCALALFLVGTYQAVSLVGVWWKTGLRFLAIGLSAAFIGFLVAKLFHVAY